MTVFRRRLRLLAISGALEPRDPSTFASRDSRCSVGGPRVAEGEPPGARADVGEAFFSAPIDPTDITRDWGRSDNDQRHRFALNGTINTSMAPADDALARLTHGFQASGMLQYYLSLPFNITSGITSLQGTTGRPLAGGEASGPTSMFAA